MKKIKAVQDCLKERANWSKTNFGVFSPPLSKKMGQQKKLLSKMTKNQSWSKLHELARKRFLEFLAPLPPKINGVPNK